MNITNARSKLAKAGFAIVSEDKGQLNSRLVARKTGLRDDILIVAQSGEVIIIRTKPRNEDDDMQSDYSAGSYWDNLTQAIKHAY